MSSEFNLIKKYFTHPTSHTRLGVGDDAALVKVRDGHVMAISVDLLIQGQHFFPDAEPGSLGYKSLAVNLSDMAAMGARPRWATLALSLPHVDEVWLKAFSRGFMQLARHHGVDLIGGDTTRGPLSICVQIMGEVLLGKALRRSGAKVLDDIWVSGFVGDAALAVAAKKKKLTLTPTHWSSCEKRLDRPTPRVSLGLALQSIAHSAIDVSDGLVGDLQHICEASGLAAVVELECLPQSSAMRCWSGKALGLQALLSGGDDYELCFTAPVSRRAAVRRVGQKEKVPLTRIGRMISPPLGVCAVAVTDKEGIPIALKRRGFDHFDH